MKMNIMLVVHIILFLDHAQNLEKLKECVKKVICAPLLTGLLKSELTRLDFVQKNAALRDVFVLSAFFYHSEEQRRHIPEWVRDKLLLETNDQSIREKNLLYNITKAQQSTPQFDATITRLQRDHLRSLVGKKEYAQAELLLNQYIAENEESLLFPESPKWVKDLLYSPKKVEEKILPASGGGGHYIEGEGRSYNRNRFCDHGKNKIKTTMDISSPWVWKVYPSCVADELGFLRYK